MSEFFAVTPFKLAGEILASIQSGCSSAQCVIIPKKTPTREYCRCIHKIEEILLALGSPYRAIEKLEDRVNEADYEVDRKDDEIGDLESALNFAEDEKEDLANEVQVLKDENLDLARDLEAANKTIDDLAEAVADLNGRISDLDDELREALERGES
jgi:chromosome segregation ATPase